MGGNYQKYLAEVFGTASGAWAEYAAAREIRVAAKPSSVSFAEAAAVPIAATTALQALRDHGQLQTGQRVLVNGASGGVGTYAVQLAKSFGADVTAVCSTANVDLGVASRSTVDTMPSTKGVFLPQSSSRPRSLSPGMPSQG